MSRVFGSIKYWFPGLVVIAFILAMVWARERDPLVRMEFSLKTGSGGKVEGMAVLPKPVAKHPVVIYVHGAGGSLLTSGRELRQIAELGMAVVGIEYDKTNQSVFDEQFIALHKYLTQQSWAQSNATAWVGYCLGAQRTLSFALTHPEFQPQLLVRMAGGWIPELDGSEHSTFNIQHPTSNFLSPSTLPASPERFAAASNSSASADSGATAPKRPAATVREHGGSGGGQPSTRIHCPVLLVHGEQDGVFPVKDCQRLAELLRADGTRVEVRTLPQLRHDFGEDRAPVMRGVAEYCAARLPLTDYSGAISGCRLTLKEAQRFNLSMRLAGQQRRELWRAVTASREPERHTVMNVIGGLEDYDLAHISAAQLKGFVCRAWQARRKYPWCRDTPLEIFDRFTANPRIYEEPLEKTSFSFVRRPLPEVKYCHTTAQVSDAVWVWMRRWARFRDKPPAAPETTARQMIREARACAQRVTVYAYLGRSIGLATRPTYIVWPTRTDVHWSSEVWSVEEKQWHAVDGSNDQRDYNAFWVLGVPKATMHSTTGERGGWNALGEQRWEAFTNTIGLFFPSGQVVVRVLDRGQPVKGQRVAAQTWLAKEVFSVAAARTDEMGGVRLTLGQSALYPYRLLIDRPGETDWQWLVVQTNQSYAVTLDIEKPKAFDKSAEPPPLSPAK